MTCAHDATNTTARRVVINLGRKYANRTYLQDTVSPKTVKRVSPKVVCRHRVFSFAFIDMRRLIKKRMWKRRMEARIWI